MERFKHFALTLLIAVTSLTATAYDFKVDGIYYNILSKEDLTCEVTYKDSKYNSYIGDIAIPSTVTSNTNTYNVTSIGNNTFYGCTSLTSVEIPNSITSIGEQAFYVCTSLTSVEIPNSVTSIGEQAFYGCSGLPVENNLRYADTYLVGVVDKTLNTYTIKDGVKWIGSGAFHGCSSLISVEIPNSVTSIGEQAFYGCTSLTSVTIPESVTEIGHWAFFGCTGLTSVTIPYSVTSIEWCSFYGCTSLISVEIPNSVTSIGEQAFYGCTSLTSVKIPNSVTSIGSEAFSYCSSLTSVTIPNSVTTIGQYAFYGCTSLTSVTIPNSVTTIGQYAFYGCTSLTSVTIPNSVTTIGNNAFWGCSGLTSVEISNSVTTIGDNAFWGCSGLTSVEISNSVTTIGEGAFSNCPNIESFSGKFAAEDHRCLIVDEVLKAFAPAGLTSYTIPNSVTSIGHYAFYYCSSLKSVVIPNSVKTIGYKAFHGCEIKYATFGCTPTLAKNIPCYYLKEITLQDNLTHFLAYPFNECYELTKLTSQAPEPLSLTKAQFKESQFETLEVIVPDDALEKYMVADVWKEFKNLRGVNLKDVEVNTCGNPVLSIVEGQLKIELPTEGSKCKYSITTTDTKSGDVESGTSISLSGEYKITAYAFADGYKNSETVTATLVWVNPTLDGSTDVISMEATKAVLIRSNGNSIIISGSEYGERVDLYDLCGNLISTKVAEDSETIIPCNANKGEIIIVKYGDKAVKCRI